LGMDSGMSSSPKASSKLKADIFQLHIHTIGKISHLISLP
jgi:hypothetical protein